MLSFFHWHLLHSSLSGGNKLLEFYTGEKKMCKRDGSRGRVFSGCPGCYLGSIRVYPYNRGVAIIFLPTEHAASFSCSRVFCVWLHSDYIRQRCVVDSNSLNPGTEMIGTTRCLSRKLLCSCVPKNVMNFKFCHLA